MSDAKQKESPAELVVKLWNVVQNDVAPPNDACAAVHRLYASLLPNHEAAEEPNDEDFAQAIGAGLLETCLQFFVVYEVVIESVGPFEQLFMAAGRVVMSRKSRKAIRERASSIRETAEALLQSDQGETSKKHARLALAVVDKAMTSGGSDAAFSVHSASCYWCSVVLSAAEIKQCAGCKRAFYCSRECQVRDWKEGGHKQDCRLMAANGMPARAAASGASKKEVKNAKKLERNASAIGSRLFDEKVGDILALATARGSDILDCVVMLDVCETPPTFDLELASEFLERTVPNNSHEDAAHMVRTVKRNRQEGSLTVACKTPPIGGACVPDGSGTFLVMTYPVAPGNPPWSEMQKSFSR